jgi:hypothetical protein
MDAYVDTKLYADANAQPYPERNGDDELYVDIDENLYADTDRVAFFNAHGDGKAKLDSLTNPDAHGVSDDVGVVYPKRNFYGIGLI